eukprot:Opistho-2@21964
MGRLFAGDWRGDLTAFSRSPSSFLAERGLDEESFVHEALQTLCSDCEPALKSRTLTALQEHASLLFTDATRLEHAFASLQTMLTTSLYENFGVPTSSQASGGDAMVGAAASVANAGYARVFGSQVLVTLTTMLLDLDVFDSHSRIALGFVDFLLEIAAARLPTDATDPVVRSTACECLREMELSRPGMLGSKTGALLSVAQDETTLAVQSYATLFCLALRNRAWEAVASLESAASPAPGEAAILLTSEPLRPYIIGGSHAKGGGEHIAGRSAADSSFQNPPSLPASLVRGVAGSVATSALSNLAQSHGGGMPASASASLSGVSATGATLAAQRGEASSFNRSESFYGGGRIESRTDSVKSDVSAGAVSSMSTSWLVEALRRDIRRAVTIICDLLCRLSPYGVAVCASLCAECVRMVGMAPRMFKPLFLKSVTSMSAVVFHAMARLRDLSPDAFDAADDTLIMDHAVGLASDPLLPREIAKLVVAWLSLLPSVNEVPGKDARHRLLRARYADLFPSPFDDAYLKGAKLVTLARCFPASTGGRPLLDGLDALHEHKYHPLRGAPVIALFRTIYAYHEYGGASLDDAIASYLVSMRDEQPRLTAGVIALVGAIGARDPSSKVRSIVLGACATRLAGSTPEEVLAYLPETLLVVKSLALLPSIRPAPFIALLHALLMSDVDARVRTTWQHGDTLLAICKDFVSVHVAGVIPDGTAPPPSSRQRQFKEDAQVVYSLSQLLLMLASRHGHPEIRDRARFYAALLRDARGESLRRALALGGGSRDSASAGTASTAATDGKDVIAGGDDNLGVSSGSAVTSKWPQSRGQTPEILGDGGANARSATFTPVSAVATGDGKAQGTLADPAASISATTSLSGAWAARGSLGRIRNPLPIDDGFVVVNKVRMVPTAVHPCHLVSNNTAMPAWHVVAEVNVELCTQGPTGVRQGLWQSTAPVFSPLLLQQHAPTDGLVRSPSDPPSRDSNFGPRGSNTSSGSVPSDGRGWPVLHGLSLQFKCPQGHYGPPEEAIVPYIVGYTGAGDTPRTFPYQHSSLVEFHPLAPFPASIEVTASFSDTEARTFAGRLAPLQISFADLFLPVDLAKLADVTPDNNSNSGNTGRTNTDDSSNGNSGPGGVVAVGMTEDDFFVRLWRQTSEDR